MRRLTKIVAVAAVASLTFAGCSKNDDSEPTATDSSSSSAATSNDVCKDASGDGPKVGLAYDVGGRGDQSFNDSAYAGLEKAVNDLGATCTEGEETTLANATNKVTLVVKARGTREGTFVCKDASGRETGRARVDPEGQGLASWDLGGGRVYVILRNGSELVAYDAATCARSWSVKDLVRPEFGSSTTFHPESVTYARGRLFVSGVPPRNRGHRYVVLDPATGAVVSWL